MPSAAHDEFVLRPRHNEGDAVIAQEQLVAAGSYLQAQEHFVKAIRMCPDEASPHLALGRAFFFQKCSRTIRPQSPAGHSRRGLE